MAAVTELDLGARQERDLRRIVVLFLCMHSGISDFCFKFVTLHTQRNMLEIIMLTKRHGLLFTLVSSSLMALACGKKTKSAGDGLGVPAIEPPVAAAIPAGLKGSSAGLNLTYSCSERPDEACSDTEKIAILTDRVFLGKQGCNGSAPSDVQGRIRCALNSIDIQIAAMDSAATSEKGSKRACLSQAVKDFSMTIPGVGVFTQKYSCFHKQTTPAGFVGDQYMAFGTDAGIFYLREMQTSGNIRLVKVNTATGETEVVIVDSKNILGGTTGDSADGRSTGGAAEHDGQKAIFVQHILANSKAKTFQYSAAGNHSIGMGVSCGVQVRSNESNIWTNGIFAEPLIATLGTNCAETHRLLQTCLTTSLVEAEDAVCAAASINSFGIDAIRPADIPQTLIATITDLSFTTQLTDTSVSASK